MSGTRCKALRRQFKLIHGRVPIGTTWKPISTWKNRLGRWFTMDVIEPSEWRHVKRDWKRGNR